MNMEMNLNMSASEISAGGDPDTQEIPDRRCETRESSSHYVTITNLAKKDVLLPAYLIDMSTFGIGLVLTRPLDVLGSYAVEWDDVIVLADVVYCSDAGPYYRVGLKTSYIIFDRTTRS